MRTVELTNGLVIDTALCTACRACELACHYHHQGTFGTAAASLRVDFDGEGGAIRIGFDASCDACVQELEPRCAHACTPGAIRVS
jgi:Fe-S-cluster-containing dehydrogenase component